MITAHSAWSIRRRGCSSDGKNDPVRVLGSHLHIAGGRGQQPRTMAVALAGAGVGAFVRYDADPLGQLRFDQVLQRAGEQMAEHRAGGVVDKGGGNSGQVGIMRGGHRVENSLSSVERTH